MTAVLRVGLVRLCGLNGATPATAALLQVRPNKTNSHRTIMGRAMRGGPRVPKAPPFPYKEKNYNVITSFFDRTSKRFDENSKVICVEGPIAAGKTKFAKELAEELDMLYVPEANMDMLYINSYGYNLRELDKQLPEDARSHDVTNFCRDPNHINTANFQIEMYQLRYELYVDALYHLLSTGQGVVMDRSPYSDEVFLEAMHKNGYISRGAHNLYHDIRNNTINELLKPHLVIYLDLPVDAVKKRIKERNIDYEVNSKVFTDQYLADLEYFYKHHYLNTISTHAELLMYDWTSGGETEVVVEDIERIDFDEFEKDRHNKKMKDWRFPLEPEYAEARMRFGNEKHTLMNYFNIPRFDVPELLRSAESSKIWNELWYNAPGNKYLKGYNADMGDTGLLTKTKTPLYEKW